MTADSIAVVAVTHGSASYVGETLAAVRAAQRAYWAVVLRLLS